jgi:hypothetical protein
MSAAVAEICPAACQFDDGEKIRAINLRNASSPRTAVTNSSRRPLHENSRPLHEDNRLVNQPKRRGVR